MMAAWAKALTTDFACASSIAGPVVGPVIGGYLCQTGWRSNYYLLLGVVGVSVLSVIFFLPETYVRPVLSSWSFDRSKADPDIPLIVRCHPSQARRASSQGHRGRVFHDGTGAPPQASLRNAQDQPPSSLGDACARAYHCTLLCECNGCNTLAPIVSRSRAAGNPEWGKP